MIKLIAALQTWLATRESDERGATMVEYGLMLALIAVVCIVAIGVIGTNANGMFTTVGNALAAV